MKLETRRPSSPTSDLQPKPPTVERLAADSQESRALLENAAVGFALVKIIGTSVDQALFTGPIAPEGTVSFGSLGESVDVIFTDESPLVGVNHGARIVAGPSVPFDVRADARGVFPFTMSGPGLGRTFLIDVEPGVPTRSLGFRSQPLALVTLEIPTKSSRGELLLELENTTDGPARVDLLPYEGPIARVELAANETQLLKYTFAVLGSVLRIQLDPVLTVINQSGGTEQVEIILEPD